MGSRRVRHAGVAKYATSIPVTGRLSSRISPTICPIRMAPASIEIHAPTSGLASVATVARAALPPTASARIRPGIT